MITAPRLFYKPFEYPQFYNYWEKANQSHWLPSEVGMSQDIQDWKLNLKENEKTLIGNILKSFIQSEILIQEFWCTKVYRWFPKPEIQLLASTFSAFEGIHQVGYAYLNDSLGLDDYSAFLKQPSALAKIDRLINTKGNSKHDKAMSLAVFSAFNEGVNLYSAFAILMSFSRRNLLKGTSQIIRWSQIDENFHSLVGCELFRIFIQENSELWVDEFKKEIYDAARLTVQLEDDFIDMCFELGDVENITKAQVKNFVRHRANNKLIELGLKKNWKNIDQDLLKEMEWFDAFTFGTEHQDFFAMRPTSYSRGTVDWDSIFD